jgi:hypothetical protein
MEYSFHSSGRGDIRSLEMTESRGMTESLVFRLKNQRYEPALMAVEAWSGLGVPRPDSAFGINIPF